MLCNTIYHMVKHDFRLAYLAGNPCKTLIFLFFPAFFLESINVSPVTSDPKSAGCQFAASRPSAALRPYTGHFQIVNGFVQNLQLASSCLCSVVLASARLFASPFAINCTKCGGIGQRCTRHPNKINPPQAPFAHA